MYPLRKVQRMLALIAAIVLLGGDAGTSHPAATLAQTVKDLPDAGAIAFLVNQCSADKESLEDSVRLTIYGSDGRVALERTFSWHDRDPNPIQWLASVPAGVYRYSLWGNQGQYCVLGGSLAVLPGSVRPVLGTMWPHATLTFLPPVYVYGLAPMGYTISVVRIPESAHCNSGISDPRLTFVDRVERDTVGYYARDTSLQHIFGVRVDRAPGDARTFRVTIAGDDPHNNRGQPPAIRFDITPAVLQAAFLRPAGTLICP